METHIAPLDPAERDLAVAQLDYIVLTKRVRGRRDWKEAVLQWHCEAVAKARAEAWIPGMARDPSVEAVLTRFYSYTTALALKRLRAENLKLRKELLDALGPRWHESEAPEPSSVVEGLQSNGA
jgi:hypothetical protein